MGEEMINPSRKGNHSFLTSFFLIFLFSSLQFQLSTSVKVEDFKKCTDAAFCNRLLGTRDEGYYIDPASVQFSGPSVTARLLNKAKGTDVTLTMKAYKGFVRLLVNEDASKKRFEVPGVLMHDLGSREAIWSKKAQTAQSLLLQLEDAEMQLQYSPFQIGISIKGKPVMSFNGRQMFNFEHLRQKQVLEVVNYH